MLPLIKVVLHVRKHQRSKANICGRFFQALIFLSAISTERSKSSLQILPDMMLKQRYRLRVIKLFLRVTAVVIWNCGRWIPTAGTRNKSLSDSDMMAVHSFHLMEIVLYSELRGPLLKKKLKNIRNYLNKVWWRQAQWRSTP